MEKDPFRLTELKIGKMPGLPRGLKPYEGLSTNINVIAGPNASGKSSTARAIQKLIWQHHTDGLQIDGHALIGDESWDIRIDSRHIKVQRDGKEDELKGLPAAEERSRYMLALHELIKADEGDLAKQIIKESIGGYDLEQARQQLSYSSTIKNRGVSEFKQYEDTEKAVREQQEKQKNIKKEEERLSDLNEQKEEAKEAAKRKELFEKVVQYLKAKLDFDQKEQRYQHFPEVLEKANGEEYQRIEELEKEIKDADQAVLEAKEIIKKSENTLEQLNIPEDGISPEDLLELEMRVEKLEDLEEEITDFKSEKKKQETSREEALKSIDIELESTGWDGLDLKDISELDQFYEKAHRTASTKRFLEKEIEELEKQIDGDTNQASVLQKGIEALSQWLQDPRGVSGFPSWVIISIIVVSALAATVTIFWWPAGAIGLGLILGLTLYGLWKSKKEPGNQRIKIREEDYRKTGLPVPEQWDADAVRKKLEELIGALQESHWQERIAQELEKRSDQIGDLQKQIEDIEKKGEELKNRLSTLPELPFEDPQNYNALYWFIIHAQKWQEANAEVLALDSQLESKEEALKAKLKLCSELFKKYKANLVKDAAEAKARFEYLKQQEETRQDAGAEITEQSSIIEKNQELIEDKTEKLKEIYSKLEIEIDKKDEVRLLLDQLDKYKEAKEEYGVSKKLLSEKKMAMENHSMYEEMQSRIEGLTLDEAKDKCQELEKVSDQLEEISRDITEIETNVASVKEGHSLEDALKERDETLLELQQLYDQNISSITGNFLVDQLKQQVREQNRPRVFHEADKLFNRITKGRYEIKIDEKEEPEFIAYDTVEKIGKTLNELSTGTRIQLLLSVRMAFVVTQESTVKLPILADELLANSDDVRAKAIIEALTEISRDGRQIFYFTAQADEVVKWQSYLSETDGIDHKLYELPGDYPESGYVLDGKEIESIKFLHNVPDPDNHSYEEYEEELGVKSYNLLLDEPEQLHLWYLYDDLKLLHRCLKHGIDRWGELKSYLNHGGTIEGLDENILARLKEKVQILERFQNVYRQGRPKPIDRNVLERSGAVSGNFINEVSKKVEEVNKNPLALINALRNGEVARFLSSKTNELENYLLDKGFIDDRESLETDEIQTRMQAFISRSDINQDDGDKFLKRLLDSN